MMILHWFARLSPPIGIVLHLSTHTCGVGVGVGYSSSGCRHTRASSGDHRHGYDRRDRMMRRDRRDRMMRSTGTGKGTGKCRCPAKVTTALPLTVPLTIDSSIVTYTPYTLLAIELTAVLHTVLAIVDALLVVLAVLAIVDGHIALHRHITMACMTRMACTIVC